MAKCVYMTRIKKGRLPQNLFYEIKIERVYILCTFVSLSWTPNKGVLFYNNSSRPLSNCDLGLKPTTSQKRLPRYMGSVDGASEEEICQSNGHRLDARTYTPLRVSDTKELCTCSVVQFVPPSFLNCIPKFVFLSSEKQTNMSSFENLQIAWTPFIRSGETLCRLTTIICTAKCQRLTLCKNVRLLFLSSNSKPKSNKATLSQTSGPTRWDRKMVSWTNIDDQLQCLVEYYEHFPHSHHSRAFIFSIFFSIDFENKHFTVN
jgi:hypothetical protein